MNSTISTAPRSSIVSDLSNPTFIKDFSNGLNAADHNLYVVGDYIFAANYASGLRIFDATDPVNLTEVGSFDTFPANDNGGFVGAWNVFPFFPSGNLIVSDRQGGLFVLDPTRAISPATVATRNQGSNPNSYSAGLPILGSTWTGNVDLTTTGHSMALVFAFDSTASLTLGGGQALLLGGNNLFTFPIASGPQATISASIPTQTDLVGMTIYTQALHLGGQTPFALSNAQDLTVGY